MQHYDGKCQHQVISYAESIIQECLGNDEQDDDIGVDNNCGDGDVVDGEHVVDNDDA